jgi:dienelactone hydrolase
MGCIWMVRWLMRVGLNLKILKIAGIHPVCRSKIWEGGWTIWLVAGMLLSSCSPPQVTALPTRAAATTELPKPAVTVISQLAAPSATLLPTASLVPIPTVTPPPSATPDPYQSLTISALAARSYGGGEVQNEEVMAVNGYFTRTLITYPSDGLKIYGFMDVPRRGEPPYPVIIAIHGYIEPDIYQTLDYTTHYADALARAGFLVLHPNLRDYPPSDSGDNLFRVGMAVDILNLIAIVKETGGKPGALQLANPQAIGMWGHSMGGGITLRVITVSPDVRVAVLYGAMSGDEVQNWEAINRWSNGQRGLAELKVPVSELAGISPINFLDRIQAAVSINHGQSDPLVPLKWSLDLCDRLKALAKSVECYTYKNEPHTFNGEGDQLFIQRSIDFYRRELLGP